MSKFLTSIPFQKLKGNLLLNEPMSKHTSWRVGGIADGAYLPANLEDLGVFLGQLDPACPVLMTGLGSNVLVRDKGYRGVVVLTNPALNLLKVEETSNKNIIYAEAGVPSPKLAKFAANKSLEGLEFLAGVPGTVGGALAMNAGCYGKETWQVVSKVRTVNRQGVFFLRHPKDFCIEYRDVASKSAKDEFFVAGWFKTARGFKKDSLTKIKELLKQRLKTQPIQQPNAGSVFRNPPGDFAAKLIDECGLKGFRVGGASVSRKHANFFVNTGDATAKDFESLMATVKNAVLEQSGIELKNEVVVVGDG